ncbi:hypothetical protein [Actinomycetospora sp. NBC_00405]|uniref:hypothetical protein n=1 Tax=Actinomycetospora sp. NBC_00405 TaxID=2975952 RepID=UPI002E225812
MADRDLNPRDWRDVRVLRARAVLAEALVVDLLEAHRGLRAHAAATGLSVHDVARQVCDGDVAIDRDLCVVTRLPPECPDLVERARNAVETTRKTYLCLADAAEALAATYDRLADTREAHAREAGATTPGEDVRATRRRAEAERREAQRLRRAAEGPHDDEDRR